MVAIGFGSRRRFDTPSNYTCMYVQALLEITRLGRMANRPERSAEFAGRVGIVAPTGVCSGMVVPGRQGRSRRTIAECQENHVQIQRQFVNCGTVLLCTPRCTLPPTDI